MKQLIFMTLLALTQTVAAQEINPQFKELNCVFQGTNKPALRVVVNRSIFTKACLDRAVCPFKGIVMNTFNDQKQVVTGSTSGFFSAQTRPRLFPYAGLLGYGTTIGGSVIYFGSHNLVAASIDFIGGKLAPRRLSPTNKITCQAR